MINTPARLNGHLRPSRFDRLADALRDVDWVLVLRVGAAVAVLALAVAWSGI